MDGLDILVTNDDGIDSVGFHALYEELSTIGSVTAVAPADDQSAVGRTVSQSAEISEHELGYVIEGTPSDCVIAGLSSLVPETDLVVAGCNRGANMGAGVLGRSGTVSAAVEAVFHGVPGIATSMYIPSPSWEKADPVPADQYQPAVASTAYLADRAFETGIFDDVDYLNINAPVADKFSGEMEITQPSEVYELSSKQDGDSISLYNPIWEKLASGEIPDPEGTDRRAILNGRVSVSPLDGSHAVQSHDGMAALAEQFSG